MDVFSGENSIIKISGNIVKFRWQKKWGVKSPCIASLKASSVFSGYSRFNNNYKQEVSMRHPIFLIYYIFRYSTSLVNDIN